jgi:hypothetical protein
MAEGVDVVDGDADGLVAQVPLFDGNFGGFDADLLEAADGDQALFLGDLHAFDEGRHGHQARDAQDDAQHGQERAELVRPDLLEPTLTRSRGS